MTQGAYQAFQSPGTLSPPQDTFRGDKPHKRPTAEPVAGPVDYGALFIMESTPIPSKSILR